MKIGISEAKAKLSALIDAALSGERVILTNRGRPVAEITPLSERPAKRTPAEKLAIIQEIVDKARRKAKKGVSAATADNFLYGDDGLPS